MTTHGKPTPMDPEPDPNGAWVIDGKTDEGAPLIRQHEPLLDAPSTQRFRPHWATCPHADQHRKHSKT